MSWPGAMAIWEEETLVTESPSLALRTRRPSAAVARYLRDLMDLEFEIQADLERVRGGLLGELTELRRAMEEAEQRAEAQAATEAVALRGLHVLTHRRRQRRRGGARRLLEHEALVAELSEAFLAHGPA